MVGALALGCGSEDDGGGGGAGAGGSPSSPGSGGALVVTGGSTGSGGGSPGSGGGGMVMPGDQGSSRLGGPVMPGDPAGSGGSIGTGGSSSRPDSCGASLTGIVRDFESSHPDFEFLIESDPGIVLDTLGSDGKPVYAGEDGNPTTNGQAAFDQWYRDVAGVNQSFYLTLNLVQSAGNVYTFHDSDFFPLDGAGFGDEGNAHNYHFTFELQTEFRYNGGEIFRFVGDDDLFTFINGQLVIDLGGVHGAQEGEVDLDDQAAALGLVVGEIYPLAFFFAERHTTESNFRIETSLEFVDCGPIVVQ